MSAPSPAPTQAQRRSPITTLARWIGATGAAGALVGVAEASGLGGTATLLLPGLAIGLAQRLAAPERVPAIWTLFSGLAWVAGVLLDATFALRPEGLGLWLIPTATMAAWQTFLLGDLRRAWTWLPASLLAAVALQATAQAACAVACAPLAQGIGPAAATIWTYLAGFAGYGLVTGLALTWISSRRS
jgi:hypothetical protein